MKNIKNKYSDFFNLDYHYDYDSDWIFKFQKWFIISLLAIVLASAAFKGISYKVHQSDLKSAENAKIAAKKVKEKEVYKKQHFIQVKNDVEATLTKTEDDHMRYAGNVDDSKKPELKAPIYDDVKSLKAAIKQLDKMPSDDDVNVLKTSINNELNLLDFK